MKKLFLISFGIICSSMLLSAQQLAFPGAEGYGKYVSGGRGNGETGRVAIVSNLEDDAENPPIGSFRWATKQGIDTIVHPIYGNIKIQRPLTIVFQVGGVISLKDDLRVKRDNLTIAGQTAPGDGICFRGATLNFGGSNNLIVRYIRSRPGDELGLETSAFRVENGSNFIIDHCSFSWAIEETTHFSSSPNFTVQWCIISESLYNSFHKKGERGYGSQHGGMYASYHHNLMAHHNSRTPRINGSNENDVEALVDYRNNVNYNFGRSGSFYGGEWMKTNGLGFAHTNVVNNYFIPGPGNYGTLYFVSPGTGDNGFAGWYINGNVMVGEAALSSDNWLGVNYTYKDSIRFDTEFVHSDGVIEDYENYTQSAEDAYHSLVDNVGATLPKRDAHDTRIIKEMTGEIDIVRYAFTDTSGQVSPVRGIESGIIDTQNNLVSPEDREAGISAWDVYKTIPQSEAPLDSDRDGIPNAWETEHGLNPDDKSDGILIAENGYSNLENYLNSMDINTSASEIPVMENFQFYPNPFSNTLFFENVIPVKRIEIYTIYGNCIYTESNKLGITEIDGSMLVPGFYLVKATDFLNQVHIGKVLKQQ
ncbi:T9SS type A sorting domain-containing protein [uncultured Draconibacterium sp.]|uniref:T9SS type A sorting domain-containing protein n=1 Tax=uncultured Draconibacterium sp. TaxID=1573823 RepID=UPI00321724BC